MRLRAGFSAAQSHKRLEPDSSSHQEPSFCSSFSQSSKDLFVSGNHLDTVNIGLYIGLTAVDRTLQHL